MFLNVFDSKLVDTFDMLPSTCSRASNGIFPEMLFAKIIVLHALLHSEIKQQRSSLTLKFYYSK